MESEDGDSVEKENVKFQKIIIPLFEENRKVWYDAKEITTEYGII